MDLNKRWANYFERKNIWKRQKSFLWLNPSVLQFSASMTQEHISLFPKKVVSFRPEAKWQVNNIPRWTVCFVLLCYPGTSWETICSPLPSGQTFKAKSSCLHSYILWFLGRICLYQWCTSFALKTHPLMQEQKGSIKSKYILLSATGTGNQTFINLQDYLSSEEISRPDDKEEKVR